MSECKPEEYDSFSIGGVASPVARVGDIVMHFNIEQGAAFEDFRRSMEVMFGDCVVMPEGATIERIDPRAIREQRRRDIDAVLAEDARQYPAFAVARKCAVMAKCEMHETYGEHETMPPSTVVAMLGWLCEYEDKRGIGRDPSMPAKAYASATFGLHAMAAYERARGQ